MKPYLAIFVSVFLAELGDKTQLATMIFAATPGVSRIWVGLAASLALVASTVIAVTFGSALATLVAPQRLRTAAGIGFVLIGAWLIARR